MRAGQERETEVNQNEPVRPIEFVEERKVAIGGLVDKRAAEEADEALAAAYRDEDEKVKRPVWKRMRIKAEGAEDEKD